MLRLRSEDSKRVLLRIPPGALMGRKYPLKYSRKWFIYRASRSCRESFAMSLSASRQKQQTCFPHMQSNCMRTQIEAANLFSTQAAELHAHADRSNKLVFPTCNRAACTSCYKQQAGFSHRQPSCSRKQLRAARCFFLQAAQLHAQAARSSELVFAPGSTAPCTGSQ